MAKHDMAEAIEHVVGGIEEVKEDLQEAFWARDGGRTGALGGPAFKVMLVVFLKRRIGIGRFYRHPQIKTSGLLANIL